MIRFIPALAAATLMSTAAPALGQDKPGAAAPQAGPRSYAEAQAQAERDIAAGAPGEAYRRAGDEQQSPEELAATRGGNVTIAQGNDRAARQEAEDQARFTREQEAYRAELARIEQQTRDDNLRHEEAERRYREAQAAHAEAEARFQAELAACRASGRQCIVRQPN